MMINQKLSLDEHNRNNIKLELLAKRGVIANELKLDRYSLSLGALDGPGI